jgi:hypothetical protein
MTHGRNLLLLSDDNLLSKASDLFVPAIPEHSQGHVDGALMVRNHHRNEIPVNVARRPDRHIGHHGAHGTVVLREKGLFV